MSISVVKSKRGVSNMEFIYNARKLQIYTIKRCINFPKRYTFYIGTNLSNIATRIHENALMANSIYPQNPHEVQIRRDYLIKAKGLIDVLVAQIEVAAEMFSIKGTVLNEWMGLVSEEKKLIDGVIASDKNRYKKKFCSE